MNRVDMIDIVGRKYLSSNIENDEFSYAQVIDRRLKGHFKLDLRFYDSSSNVSILIETKQRFGSRDKKQLFDYVTLEKEILPRTKIVAILANTSNNCIKVWKINGDYEEELDDKKMKSFAEYVEYFKPKNINDKTTVLEHTSKLNRLLHDNGIPEKLRSQFVGTCLLALKNNLTYKGLNTSQIIAGIKDVLGSLLEGSVDKADKIAILHTQILQSQSVEKIKSENFERLLLFIETNIVPYINESSNEGHDILSYFFTTFNKYVAREDKNQAFTPNHIAQFMATVAGIYRTSRILDPTCGSGTFLVQAMTQALNQCDTNEERDAIKREQIYGIEFDRNVYGLATTNMLIHGDGNSNIRCGSCFDLGDWIKKSNADVVLMNPPYNASKNQVTDRFASTWSKTSTDPSKGFSFVEFVADKVGKGRLVTLLPMACAIQTDGVIGDFKQKMLEKHTLDAVFSFPTEMFYPGASAVACCMVFDLGKPHKPDKETFFGYFREDGFEKRKGVGRVDVYETWETIQKDWLHLYNHRLTVAGKSINRHVKATDEWCAEAYMKADYSKLSKKMFLNTVREYISYLVKDNMTLSFLPTGQNNGALDWINDLICNLSERSIKDSSIDTSSWVEIEIQKYFNVKAGKYYYSYEYDNGDTPYLSASNENNGVKERISIPPDFDGNCIVTGKVGCTSFYEPFSFCATSDVNILLPKFHLNVEIGLFIATIINFNENFRWNYGRQCRVGNTQRIKIFLPSKKGEPDWQFMENYIKSLPYGDRI